MKKVFLFIVLAATVTYFSSCNKDETKQVPTVTAPANQDVETGTSVDLSFSYTADGGFKSSSVDATNGTATVTTDGASGSNSGTITVSYTADDTAGAGSVILSVQDNENQTTSATAVINVVEEVTTVNIAANLTSDATWETGKTYVLQSRISVESGATLTIQPGVIIKGEAGTGANATALLIARGAKIMAEGTADQPIIFTTVADEIQPGQVESPNLDPTLNGLWGGLLVLGNAKISADAETVQIEGIPPSDQNGLYGGSDDSDNSGVLKFISIRHGGANIGEGNEINGLTLGGVGSNTVIENVEVIANQDDGIEWFGGTVNVTNALVWNPGDDGVDTDQAWAGMLDNFIVITGEDTDHALEIDGPEGSYLAGHTVKNGSIKGIANAELANFRDAARGDFENLYFFDFPNPGDEGRGDLSFKDDGSADNFSNGVLNFNALESTQANDTLVLADVFKDGTDVHASWVTKGNNTVGADVAQFGWTWASKAGMLDDF